jgi:glycosyltransferase involved in cell wall biosynthesis
LINFKDVSVVIPFYNESRGLRDVLGRFKLEEVFGKVGEIIFINDGSSDNSLSILNDLIPGNVQNVKIINHFENLGYGAALKTGIKEAKFHFVATFDADGQHNFQQLKALAASETVDVVIGKRTFNEGAPISRFLGRLVVAIFSRIIIGPNLKDFSSGLRIWKKSFILKLLPFLPNGFSFSTTSLIITMILNKSVTWISISVPPRKGFKSTLKLREGLKFLRLIFKLMLLFKPLRLFFTISIPLIVIAVYYFIYSITNNQDISTRSLIVGLSGISILLTGLMTQSLAEDRIRNLTQ